LERIAYRRVPESATLISPVFPRSSQCQARGSGLLRRIDGAREDGLAAADRESHEGNPACRLNGSCPQFPSGPLQLPKKLLPIDLCGEATLTAQKPVGASTTNQTAGGPASSEKSLPQQRPDPPKRFVALQRQLHRGAPATPSERALYQTRAISKRRPNIVACNLVHLLNFQCINPRFLRPRMAPARLYCDTGFVD